MKRSRLPVPVWLKAVAAIFLLAATNSGSVGQASKGAQKEGAQKTRIERVYVNLEGDPKLVHRLFTFLDFGFEDDGFTGANTEADSDAVVRGNLEKESQRVNIGVGIVRMEMTSGGKQEKMSHCATISSDENAELFEGAAKVATEKIRRKYPNLRTVEIEDASRMAESKVFAIGLPDSLKASGFEVTKVGPADLVLRVDLMREKIPVEESTFKYKLFVSGKDGSILLNDSGSGTLSAKLAGKALEACPNRFVDLDWLTGGDALSRLAHKVTRALRDHNAGLASFN
jgi:hypothetical protein